MESSYINVLLSTGAYSSGAPRIRPPPFPSHASACQRRKFGVLFRLGVSQIEIRGVLGLGNVVLLSPHTNHAPQHQYCSIITLNISTQFQKIICGGVQISRIPSSNANLLALKSQRFARTIVSMGTFPPEFAERNFTPADRIASYSTIPLRRRGMREIPRTQQVAGRKMFARIVRRREAK